jgi:hypothetical protein
MNAKTIISIEKPATQTVPAVCALLAWKGRSSNPLPQFVEMGSGEGRVVLVLSNKRDAYYCVTAAACSCPAAYYNHGKPCKHMRRYFPEQATAKPATIKQPNHGAWHGHNGPVLDEVDGGAKVSASPLYVDCLPDPSARDVAYWQIAEDKIMLSTLGEA